MYFSEIYCLMFRYGSKYQKLLQTNSSFRSRVYFPEYSLEISLQSFWWNKKIYSETLGILFDWWINLKKIWSLFFHYKLLLPQEINRK